MQKARRHPLNRAPTACRHVVSGSLSSPPGVLLIFRSRYLFTIGRQGVFSLAGWTPQIPSCFHVTGCTQVPDLRLDTYAYGAITLYGQPSQTVPLASSLFTLCPALLPRPDIPDGLGCSAFARRYLRNRVFLLLLQVLRCFSSLGSLCTPMDSVCNHSGIPVSTLV
jgi:hypothetical protein